MSSRIDKFSWDFKFAVKALPVRALPQARRMHGLLALLVKACNSFFIWIKEFPTKAGRFQLRLVLVV